jgi:hypothetical protein
MSRAGSNEATDLEEELFASLQNVHHSVIGELIVDEAPLSLPRDQAALSETGEMHGRIRLTEPGACDDLSGRQTTASQRGKDTQAGAVAEAPKQLCEHANVVHISG